MAFFSWEVLGTKVTKGYKRVGSHRISSFSSSSSPSFPSSFFLFLPSYSFTSSTSSSLKELNLRSFLTTNITHPLSYSVQYRRGGKDLWRSCCRMRRKMRRERRERRRQKTKKRAVVNLLFLFPLHLLLLCLLLPLLLLFLYFVLQHLFSTGDEFACFLSNKLSFTHPPTRGGKAETSTSAAIRRRGGGECERGGGGGGGRGR